MRCTSSAPASTSASTSGPNLHILPYLVSHCWKSYSALHTRACTPITHSMTKAVPFPCLLCTDFTANGACSPCSSTVLPSPGDMVPAMLGSGRPTMPSHPCVKRWGAQQHSDTLLFHIYGPLPVLLSEGLRFSMAMKCEVSGNTTRSL